MSTSRIPSCVDALVSMFTAALPIEVRDGAVLQNTERTALYVGSNLDDSRFDWEQDWAGLGHVYRDEVFSVPCVLWVRGGDTVLKPYRDEAFAHIAAIENALRASEDLGLEPQFNIRADLRPVSFSQPQTPDGAVCRADFSIRVQARV